RRNSSRRSRPRPRLTPRLATAYNARPTRHRRARMRRMIRTAALTAILLVPLVISAPADWGAPTSAQPAPSYTYQGTVRAVNARAGTLELITGVGMSLRVVRLRSEEHTSELQSRFDLVCRL